MSSNFLVQLRSGAAMPRLGLGLWATHGQECVEAVKHAFTLGYRHVDTAKYYGNERELGQAVRDSTVPRADLFLTTKLFLPGDGGSSTRQSVLESLEKAGLEYWDLVLIHNPDGGRRVRELTWHELERLVDEGRIRSLGVSNYGPQHIVECLEYCRIPPSVNQIELHPFFIAHDVIRMCKEHGIVVQAYCPLVRGQYHDNQVLQRVASAHKCSVPQVLLAWSLGNGFVPLPKSVHVKRQQENFEALGLRLSEAELADISGLDRGLDGSIEVQTYSMTAR